jgi:hypothetical protein
MESSLCLDDITNNILKNLLSNFGKRFFLGLKFGRNTILQVVCGSFEE